MPSSHQRGLHVQRRIDLGLEVVGAGLLERDVPVPALRTRRMLESVAHVPFAGEIGGIAAIPHELPEAVRVGTQEALVAGLALLVVGHDRPQGARARPMMVDAGVHHGARRFAGRSGVEIGESNAGLGDVVDVGRLDLAAIGAEVAEAGIVDHHEDDVRARLPCRFRAARRRAPGRSTPRAPPLRANTKNCGPCPFCSSFICLLSLNGETPTGERMDGV